MELLSESEINDLTLEDALVRYRDLKKLVAPMMEQIELLKNKVRDEALGSGEIVAVDGAKVVFRAEYVRSVWDHVGLRLFGATHPEVLTFVNEVKVPPTAYIRLSGVGE